MTDDKIKTFGDAEKAIEDKKMTVAQILSSEKRIRKIKSELMMFQIGELRPFYRHTTILIDTKYNRVLIRDKDYSSYPHKSNGLYFNLEESEKLITILRSCCRYLREGETDDR